MVFIKKPAFVTLQGVFDDLMQPDEKYVFYYHSDDSCITVRTEKGLVTYNIDISSCDASHTGALFGLFSRICPSSVRGTVDVLIDQCRKPFEIRSVQTMVTKFKAGKKVAFTCDDPILPSGSTLTTFINNLACILMAYSFSIHKPTTREQIMDAAADAGYDITCELCSVPEDIQFLKHSPVMTSDGTYKPLINAGVYLRTFGIAKGDFPGKGSITTYDRYVAYQSALLQGCYPYVTNPFIDALKAKFKTQHKSMIDSDLEYKIGETRSITVSNESFFARYGALDEVASTVSLIQNIEYGEIVRTTLTDTIFERDYGY